MTLKERFKELSPNQKKSVIWMVIGTILLIFVISSYQSSRPEQESRLAAKHGSKDIKINSDLMQKTLLREQRRQMDSLKEEIEQLKRERTAAAPLPQNRPPENRAVELPEIPGPEEVVMQHTIPPPPSPAHLSPMPLQPPKEPQKIGAISVLTNPADTETFNLEKPAEKKLQTVYLPPSFMEASLLTGFDAATSGTGKNNPEPLLLRIQTPAVLPNEIKANLSGCFIVAEAVGRLDKERADVRLVSLSCLSNEGKAVIDTAVKGFVTDSDSKVGLSGRVVSRMGASTARSMVAGFFGGLGEMLKSSATTQSTSALGTTSMVDSSQIAQYGLGGGLAEGANSLRDFYLDLAKQATPVIEVGATKKITVIISEGKELEIREIDQRTL